VKIFLGLDGGGSKSHFLLIEESGAVLASHTEGPAYYPEIGLEALTALLSRGVAGTLARASVAATDVTFAFFGIPAYGEDRSLAARLDAAPAGAVPAGRYRCGNDMVCGWAGALAGSDGINVVAGTGSIAYGEYAGRAARAGGWGELFGDEGSGYWFAREGLSLFSRMSDRRTPRGPLYEAVRRHFALEDDLDLCAAIYGKSIEQRSQLAQLSRLVSEAARHGDVQARALFTKAAGELVELVNGVRTQLQIPADLELAVSGSGGLFKEDSLLTAPFEAALSSAHQAYCFSPARLPPHAGAALYAARLSGIELSRSFLSRLSAGT
jgi:N-acetylglucosamine kinase-like BadF-type ATPase